MFFIHLYTRDEVIIFKNYGVKNIDIIKLLSVLTLLFGFLILQPVYCHLLMWNFQ